MAEDSEIFRKLSPDTLSASHPESEQRQQVLQYLAGYFDAASSITITEYRSFREGKKVQSFVLRVEIARVQSEAIDLTQVTFPAYEGKQQSKTQPERNRWYAKSTKAVSILYALSPWLCIKKKHVELAREFQDAAGSRTTEE